jgi:hypothetical protein
VSARHGGSGGGCPTSDLITTLIGICLQPGTVDDEPMYAGQPNQNFLLLCALISVPILLLAKPYFQSKTHAPVHHAGDDDEDTMKEEAEDDGFGETILNHQGPSSSFGYGFQHTYVFGHAPLWRLCSLGGCSYCMNVRCFTSVSLSSLGYNGCVVDDGCAQCFLHALVFTGSEDSRIINFQRLTVSDLPHTLSERSSKGLTQMA